MTSKTIEGSSADPTTEKVDTKFQFNVDAPEFHPKSHLSHSMGPHNGDLQPDLMTNPSLKGADDGFTPVSNATPNVLQSPFSYIYPPTASSVVPNFSPSFVFRLDTGNWPLQYASHAAGGGLYYLSPGSSQSGHVLSADPEDARSSQMTPDPSSSTPASFQTFLSSILPTMPSQPMFYHQPQSPQLNYLPGPLTAAATAVPDAATFQVLQGGTPLHLFRNPTALLQGSPQQQQQLTMDLRQRCFCTGDKLVDAALNELVKHVNPVEEFVFRSVNARFFVVKSFTEDNVYLSIKHGQWCSTQQGNEALSAAYRQVHQQQQQEIEVKAEEDGDKQQDVLSQTKEPHVFLFFSVNGSGFFCGVAELVSDLVVPSSSMGGAAAGNIWQQKKWQGHFRVRWRYVKDVPNSALRHIKLEHNENRPITNSRDATEIKPLEKGVTALRIVHEHDSTNSLLLDLDSLCTSRLY